MGKVNEATTVANLADNEYILIVLSDGTLGKIRKDKIILNTGCYFTIGLWTMNGWHRIALSTSSASNYISGIINIGNSYYSNPPSFSCFFVGGSAYGNIVFKSIAKGGTIFSKVRIIHKRGDSEKLYIDVFYNNSTKNEIDIAMSSCVLLVPHTIDDTVVDIPEGYTVQEFDL